MAWSQRSHSTYLHNTLVNSSDLDQTVTHSLGFQEWLTTVTIDVRAGCGLGVDMARQDFSKIKKKKKRQLKLMPLLTECIQRHLKPYHQY